MKKLMLSFVAACAAMVGANAETIDELAANLNPGEWLAVPMTGAASDIVTKGLAAKTGDRAISYAQTGSNSYKTDPTVNGVYFSNSRESFTLSPNSGIFGKDDMINCGLDTFYGNNILAHYWKGNISGASGPTTFTVTVPAAGTYLMQIVIHHTGADKVYLTENEDIAIYGGKGKAAGDDWYYGGTFVHAFTMDAAGPYQFVLQFSGEVAFNMFQLRDITQHEVTKPSIGSVTAQILKSGANIALSGIKIGTDEQGILATSYDVYFASVEQGGTLPEATKVLTGLDASSCSFAVPSLVSGKVYDYSVFVRNSGGVDSKIVTGVLDGRSIADMAKSLPVGSWMASPLTGSVGDFVAYGDSVMKKNHVMTYAKGSDSDASVGNMTFVDSRDGIEGIVVADASRSFWQKGDDGGNCGLDNFYGNTILKNYFKSGWGSGLANFTLDVPGEGTYVLQFMFHRKSGIGKKVYPEEFPSVFVECASADATGDWYYGGTLIYKFNATEAGQLVFNLNYESEMLYNMFQLRKVPHEDEPIGEVVEPSIGKASVKVRGRSASFMFVDNVIGTDDKGHAAKTYDLYVDRGDGEYAKVVEGVKSETCQFFDANLATGDYTYNFKIVNDKGCESEPKEVEFSVGEVVTISDRAATLKPGRWLALPMTGDAADIITEGVLATKAKGQPMAYMSTDKGTDPVSDVSLNNVPFIQSTEGIAGSVAGRSFNQTAEGAGNAGMGGSLYGDILMDRIFKAGYAASTATFTVTVPEKGTYLLQMVCHFGGDAGEKITLLDSDGQKTDIEIYPASATEAEGWYYGGTFVHVFKVEEACTYSFQLDYEHEIEYNMFQLRKVKRNRATIIMVK